MGYVLAGGVALLGLLLALQMFKSADIRKLVRWLRWIVGGGLALLTAFLLFRGQVGIGSMTGAAAFSILKFGRLGPLDFQNKVLHEDNESAVRSRFIAMTLDHDTGEVTGRVVAGAFKGAELIALGENDTRLLLDEVAADPDSRALLETWLDKNRAGWREYFAGGAGTEAPPSPADAEAEAYAVLGLKPGATPDEIHAAHRNLMKGVHPDQGGSTYLAAKINEARDRLLKAHAR